MNQPNINIAPLVACCLLAAVLPPAHAQEDASAREENVALIQEGLRVSYHSYYIGEIESVIEAASKDGRIQGYSHATAASKDPILKWHEGAEIALKPAQKAAVERGETDALVRGKHSFSVGTGEKSFFYLIAISGLKNNPHFRLLWQTHWAHVVGRERKKAKGGFLAPDVMKPSYDELPKKLEAEADFTNKQFGKEVVVIIPAATAVLKLRAMVAEGRFPGLSEQSELFIAKGWEGHRHVRMLTAYCNFVALYGVSPVGLSPSVDHLNYKAKGGPKHSMAGITAEQHAILQKIAWETVSKYPYGGLTKANGKTPKDESGGSP